MLCPASCSCVFIELSSPCALLRFIEERDRCLGKQAQAIETSRELLENGEIMRSLVKEGPTTILS